MKKISFLTILIFLLSLLLLNSPSLVLAEDEADLTEISTSEAGVTSGQAANANSESTQTKTGTGSLIEIGNTTAEETTIIVRVTENGVTTDQTLIVNADTVISNEVGQLSELSNWIAGDQIRYTVKLYTNSGELVALKLRNLSLKRWHFGRNGWIKTIRTDKNEMDVEWLGQIYTLNTSGAKMVAGLINPAALSDFQVGDRIRARVSEDNDGNRLTWKANTVVLLRRGNVLFVRITRWVVPAEITDIPDNTSTLPYILTAKVLDSKFYEKGDVNNLIGPPGTVFKIQVDENTKLVRRFLGRAVISEFMEGDHIRVVGRLNESTGNLDAKIIKNNSIQSLGVAQTLSEVVSINTTDNTLVVTPIAKRDSLTGKRHKLESSANWTIKIQADAKLYENGQAITLSQVVVGDIVRVRGVANRNKKIISASALSVVTDKYQSIIE